MAAVGEELATAWTLFEGAARLVGPTPANSTRGAVLGIDGDVLDDAGSRTDLVAEDDAVRCCHPRTDPRTSR